MIRISEKSTLRLISLLLFYLGDQSFQASAYYRILIYLDFCFPPIF
nr:MAG TPA: hypothetical protein [Crassvirales sp.]